MKKTITIASLMLIGLVFLSCRRHHPVMSEKHINKMADRIASKLDLDDSQKKVLDKIKAEVIANMNKMKPQRAKTFAEVQKMVLQDKIEKSAALAMMEAHQKERQANHEFFLDKILEFHAVLKPEQKKEVAELMEKFHKKFTGED